MRTVLLLTAAAALLVGPVAEAAPPGSRFVFAWPPTRYLSAEVALYRDGPGAGPLLVRVTGRGLDEVVDVPPSAAVRVPLPAEARCAEGLDDCALVVERLEGTAELHVTFQSPDTAGAGDTLLRTAHDTARIPPVPAAGRRHVVVAAPNASAMEFAETASFVTVVPVGDGARVTGGGACLPAVDVEVAAGSALTLTCVGEGEDVTGALLEADADVLVLGGNVVTTVPVDPGAGLSADLVLDVVSPLPDIPRPTILIAPPLPRHATRAGLGDIVRLVAPGAVRVWVRDDAGRDEERSLGAGEVWDLDTSGAGADRTLRVDADGPLVGWHLTKSRWHRGTGDPAAIPLVPLAEFTSSGRFFVPDGYGESQALVIVAATSGEVTLDGRAVEGWASAPGGDLRWVVVALPPGEAMTGSVHALAGAVPFGAWLLGQGGFKAHGSVAASGASRTLVLRGLAAAVLDPVATVSGRSWLDAAPPRNAFYRVGTAGAVLRVSRDGEGIALAW